MILIFASQLFFNIFNWKWLVKLRALWIRWIQCIQFEMILFGNNHLHNVVSKLTNVVKLDVENDSVVSMLSNVVHINVEWHNVDSTLFDIVNSNVEMHNIVSTLIWRCPTSRRHVNQKTTLKQRWSDCWNVSQVVTL